MEQSNEGVRRDPWSRTFPGSTFFQDPWNLVDETVFLVHRYGIPVAGLATVQEVGLYGDTAAPCATARQRY